AFRIRANTPVSRPHFERTSIQESRYTVRNVSQRFRPASVPMLTAVVHYTVGGDVAVAARSVVGRIEPRLPYGEELRELTIVPPIAVNVTSRTGIVPLAGSRTNIDARIEILNNGAPHNGSLALQLPPGWTSSPERAAFAFDRAGERSTFAFTVTPATIA